MLLLGGQKGVEEETGLGPVVKESGRDITDVGGINNTASGGGEKAVTMGLVCLLGGAVVKAVFAVGNLVEGDHHLPGTVTVVVVHRDMGAVL